MGIKGTVETFSLPDVFQNLAANHQTGCLRVYMEAPPPDTRATLATGRQPTAANMQEPATPPNGTSASGRPATDGTGTRASKQTIVAAGHEKLVYFDNGVAQFVSRGLGRPLLHAEVFLARGHINQEQLAAALARSQEVSKSAVLCLVELGTVAPETVDEVARLVIEEEIYDLFGWEKAHFEFNPGPLPEGLFAGQIMGAPPSLPITHLIMEGARRMDEWDRLRRAIGSFKDIFIVDPAARKAIEKGEMETDPIEKRVVSLVDGTRDVDDVLAESFLFKFEVLDALARLLQSSLARPASLSELALAEQECTRLTLPKRRVKVLERMLAVGGENARVRRELAEALAREDRVDTACIHYLVLAENEVAATRMDSAVELFKRILSLSPRHAKAHEHLGGIYAKRGHKREAFVHFQALYEALREQTHNREARAAAIAALDCDPAHVEMRTGLIELYLADNQKDAAVQHLEVLGDQAARAGNIKLAADSYRRAIQFAPANKNLKRKLADAMLTREDRLARKRRILVAALVITVTSLVAGAAAVKEYLNANAFSAADRDARGLAAAGEQLEQEGRFSEARERYEAAVQRYLPAANLFSPVMGYQKQAARQINELRSLSQQAARKAEEVRTDRLDDIKKKMASAETATQNKHYKKARDLYAEILNMPEAAEEERKTAQAGRDKAQKVLDDYDKVIRRLNNPDQNAEFQNVDEEAAWKRWALEEYRAFPEFKRESVELPLLIQPDTDGVQVLLDGRQAGTVNAGGGREANIFRYPAGGSHQFEFRKAGFKTVTAITAALRSATLPIRMERAPAVRVDLRGQLGADVRLAGEPACNGATLYLGTSEGSLVEFSGQEKALTARRYDVPGGGLNKEVYGPIHVHKRPGKDDFIIYCTRNGDCVGVKAAGNTFTAAWPAIKGTAVLTAPPSVISLKLMTNPVIALPAEKRLLLVDCETGLLAAGSPIEYRGTITSSASGLDQGALIIAGTKEGQSSGLSGFSLSTRMQREWNPGLRIGAVRGKPTVFEDEIIAGADDGLLYLFKVENPNPAGLIKLDGAGGIVSEPLIIRKRLFIGSADKEGFWCADLARHEQVWRQAGRDMGAAPFQPTVLDQTIYFATDKGRIYAVDSERGTVLWRYQLEGGAQVTGAPRVCGRRVYVATTEGTILGFDE